jgi:hypothetical protein
MENPSNPSSGQNNTTICVHLSRNGDHGQSQTGTCHHFVTTTKKARRIRAAKCSYTIGGELVAGAGFEPAIPHVRDYEPCSTLSFSKPIPPFCHLSKFSNFRASPRLIGLLVHVSTQGPLPRVHFERPVLCCAKRVLGSTETPMEVRPDPLVRM